jgi:glycosyltransferase involved in cell wall biosynthesis
VQYNSPLFSALAKQLELTVFYAHNASALDQARAGFGVGFAWDVDLLSGYSHTFLTNVARSPGLGRFGGVDTPEIGGRLRQGQFDAVLLMGWHLKCFIQGLVAAKQLGTPVMVRGDSHLDTPRGPFKVAVKRALYPLFLRCFDAALVVGKRNRGYWEHYHYPRTRMFDAPHCVDNAFFTARATREAGAALRDRLGIAASAKVVLFAGKLVSFKRPLDALHAVAEVRTKGINAHLLVAGAGQCEGALLEQAATLGAPLHALGFCNQTEMPAAYAAADVLVLPSDGRETWGLVVNEALASGTPALVSDAVGCAPDLAELLGHGAVFRQGDIADFSERLSDALNSPPTSQSIAAAAARFGLNTTAKAIAETAAILRKSRAKL